MTSADKFLPHLQVLRGVAILLVLLFHLDLSWMGSGYLGVDLFFVISGFLMAHLYGDIESKAKALDFYARRFWRIIPAYAVALIVSVGVAAVFFSLPSELEKVKIHGFWSAALMPNIGFWTDVAYFQDDIYRPFLHLWSLGVELQYYLIFPVVAWFGRRHAWVLVLTAIATFVAFAFVNGVSAKTSFFITLFRLWQFFAGFGAALILRWVIDHRSKGYGEWVGLIALIVIVAIATWPKPTTAILWQAGLVTFASMLVIGMGLPQWVVNSHGGRALQWLGRYSYSIYLVHFPIIIFWSYEPFGGTVTRLASPFDYAGVILLTLVLGIALHYGVEQPFRRPRSIFPLGGAMAAVAGMIMVVGVSAEALKRAQMPPDTFLIAMAPLDRPIWKCGQITRLKDPFSPICQLSPPGASGRNIFLVGNSHADMIKGEVAKAAQLHGLGVFMTVQNTAVGFGITPEWILQQAKQRNVDLSAASSALARSASRGYCASRLSRQGARGIRGIYQPSA